MKLDINKNYSGFKLLREKRIKSINSTGRLFIHERSGARLCQLENDDDNKVFSISFRTPPKDSTGIPHILEHSVLCGSRKFPTKEPFVELAKGSLNTFLNAMTFSDKTMYPVASKNEKDFFNLMDVYLDAVFHPNIYRYPEIFMQEGWHYELDSIDKDINYKGVVYSEMKGVFSSPESILFRNAQESLFPETAYGFESGGDPDVIPKLTWDNFTLYHRIYYHPSNSYIFLYGNGDILDQLKFIDEKYLNNFERIKVDSEISIQKPFSQERQITIQYPISPEEKEQEKTFLSLNFAVGRSTDPELYIAFNILEYLLLETPASPLKNALIKAKLGKDVFGEFDTSLMQPIFSIVVKNSNENRKDEFKKVVFDTLKGLVKNGIDKKLVEASINIVEFNLREADYRGFPRGLFYCIRIMDSWLYNGDPFMHLEYEKTLLYVKKALKTNYFEGLIDQYLLNNPHRSLLILNPKKGLAEEKTGEINRELAEHKARLSEEEKKDLVSKTMILRKRQESPDSQEDLMKIPLLTLNDINPEAEKLPLVVKKENDLLVLTHPLFTNKIVYLNILFDTKTIPQEDIPYIGLLTRILGKVSTKLYHYKDLSNEINIHTGGISFSAETYGDKQSDHIYYPKMIVTSKALTSKLPELFELIGEIIGYTKFNEKKRLKEIIQETKSRLEMLIFEQGHAIATHRLFSYFSPVGKYVELLAGLSFYKFIADIEENFDNKVDKIISKLKKVSNLIFNRRNMIVSITSSEEDYKKFRSNFSDVLEHLSNDEIKKYDYRFDYSEINEGLLTPGKVQYIAKGYNFKELGYSFKGSLNVLKTVASLDYLWNRLRVQGGAYGSFASFSRNGNTFFCSYRDPNLSETLDVYNDVQNYLRTFNPDKREMTKYILGTISRLDSPLTPSMKGEIATGNYISNITQEDIQTARDEVLATRKKDIREYADLLYDVMKKNYFCVLGNEEKLKENKDIFNNLVAVF